MALNLNIDGEAIDLVEGTHNQKELQEMLGRFPGGLEKVKVLKTKSVLVFRKTYSDKNFDLKGVGQVNSQTIDDNQGGFKMRVEILPGSIAKIVNAETTIRAELPSTRKPKV